MNKLKLIPYFLKYSRSVQAITKERLGFYYHDGIGRFVDHIYVCPLCLQKKWRVIEGYIYCDDDFSIDHFPPETVGGKKNIIVCKKCNNKAGYKFEFELTKWLKESGFVARSPNSKMPVELTFENIKGRYKGDFIWQGESLSLDNFLKYPFVKKELDNILAGNTTTLNLNFKSPEIELVQKSLIKAAYLFCFSIWGYDFLYTETGKKLRQIIQNSEKHILSNYGVFFHMNGKDIPSGLCYIYKPDILQSFMINFDLTLKEKDFRCSVSVLIPGPDLNDWKNLIAYQSIIDNQETFTNHFIRLPEDILSNENLTPYTNTWKQRQTFKVFGESHLQ